MSPIATSEGEKGDHEHGRKTAPNQYSAERVPHIIWRHPVRSLTSDQRSEIEVRRGEDRKEQGNVRTPLFEEKLTE